MEGQVVGQYVAGGAWQGQAAGGAGMGGKQAEAQGDKRLGSNGQGSVSLPYPPPLLSA